MYSYAVYMQWGLASVQSSNTKWRAEPEKKRTAEHEKDKAEPETKWTAEREKYQAESEKKRVAC